jgi:ribosomal protein L18E
MKKINLEKIQEKTKRIYGISSEISLLQEELENLITAIDKNSSEYQRGNISRDIFETNEKKLKKRSAMKIRKINKLVEEGIKLLEKMENELTSQKVRVQ